MLDTEIIVALTIVMFCERVKTKNKTNQTIIECQSIHSNDNTKVLDADLFNDDMNKGEINLLAGKLRYIMHCLQGP